MVQKRRDGELPRAPLVEAIPGSTGVSAFPLLSNGHTPRTSVGVVATRAHILGLVANGPRLADDDTDEVCDLREKTCQRVKASLRRVSPPT